MRPITRHIIACFFLILSIIVITPARLLHECHSEAAGIDKNYNGVQLSKQHTLCQLCEFQVSRFLETENNQDFTIDFIYSPYIQGADESHLFNSPSEPDNKGPPAFNS
ncbi:MAG: hypothetical protein H7321_08415 [Bacteroidia bacterium]|nr:hypothetical protein [Bacteroidia bacterium]